MGRPSAYSSLVSKGPTNNAGAPTNIISWQDRLIRFLVLGADGPTYYAEKTLHMKQGVAAVVQAFASGGKDAVALAVSLMVSGRLPKMETGIFVLAFAINSKIPEVRAAAINAIPTACKIPTHLFSLLTEIKAQGGKVQGRALTRALGRWYTEKEPSALAYHLIKYRQRNGWKHGDVLRLAHPKGYTSGSEGKAGQLGDLFAWETGKPIVGQGAHLSMIIGYLSLLQEEATENDAIKLIRNLRFPREGIPDKLLKSAAVWRALAVNSPMTALFRTLNRMTAAEAFEGPEGRETLSLVIRKLTDAQAIRGAKVHPINVLSALRTYGSGRGVKGSLTWSPKVSINTALDQAFVASFDAQPPMRLRIAIGVDISGSMHGGEIAKIPGLTPAEAAWAVPGAATVPRCTTAQAWKRAPPPVLPPLPALPIALRIVAPPTLPPTLTLTLTLTPTPTPTPTPTLPPPPPIRPLSIRPPPLGLTPLRRPRRPVRPLPSRSAWRWLPSTGLAYRSPWAWPWRIACTPACNSNGPTTCGLTGASSVAS